MDELNQLMQMLNMPIASNQMSKMMSEISTSDDGEISLEDFLVAMKAEQTNPHTRHLLLRDFELFRPSSCEKGYIPREQLVEVLLHHANGDQQQEDVKESSRAQPQQESGGGGSGGGGSGGGSGSGGSSMTEADRLTLEEQRRNEERHEGTWSESSIRDLIHNIPLDCFHMKKKNLINYEKLIQTMINDDIIDPFLIDDE